MGVYADKIVGYMVDVTEEYIHSNYQEIWSKYIYNCNGNTLTKELINLGFKPYYSDNKPTENNIMLIYDGMSGEYAKLIYIKSVEYYSNDESDPSPIVNEALKSIIIPTEIQEKLKKVYSIIFNSTKDIEIYLQEFTHWH